MTHCDRVLRLLSDGQPHTHHELYALHVIAHSRVSDLRKQGYTIVQWRDGDNYLYQLTESPVPLQQAVEPDRQLALAETRAYGWEPS